ncbi:MAG: ABC transporter substrate-binding protein [Clostridiales Family XIII bacterium]|jgi:branched-chain amino acid transport system substrate-binding protein|nr:ABC transporter substrate-binding protein [Clostridiales Family XIII bacterium]
MKKKVLTAVLCIAMIFAMAACGGGGGDNGGDGDSGAVSARDEILIGFAAPMTGPLAIFMGPTSWVEDLCLAAINDTNGGIYVEEADAKLPVRVIYADTESDSNKAMEVATKLATEDKVDILVGAWTPVGANPISAVGERYEIPTFTFGAPEESWLEGGPYHWATGMHFNYDMLCTDVINMWDKLDTNKKVGFVFDTDVDGTTGREIYTELLDGTGYEIFDPGAYTIGSTDFTGMISKLKDANCDIITADMITPDFATFWKQCHQYGYVPKVCTINKGMHYEADVEQLDNDGGNGITFSSLWDKNFPFSSPLLGMECIEIADKWESENEGFYPYSIGYDVAMYDIIFDVLNRAQTLDKDAVLGAILDTDIDTVFGNLTFNENQCAEVPAIGTQWLPGEKFAFEKKVVASETFPAIPSFDPIIIPATTQN